MYKIFIQDKPLIIIDPSQEEPDYFPFELQGSVDLLKLKALLSDPRIDGAFWKHDNPSLAFRRLMNHCTFIQAAGGLISKDNKLFFIYRNSVWDLPKGKIEEGEGPEAAARREIKEETGLSKLKLIGYAGNTWHMYDGASRDKMMIKKTFWYNYELTEMQEIVLEKQEGIENYKWITNKVLPSVLKNSYGSISDIIRSNSGIHLPRPLPAF